MMGLDEIVVRGASENNLRDVNVTIPRLALTAVTGVSGSGKSSLAFQTIYQEGQRRYVESLSPYARQFLGRMDKPKVESIEGLSPTLLIDQKTAGRNPRSTLGTMTEIYDHLRLLFARLGTCHCPECGEVVKGQTVEAIVESIAEKYKGTYIVIAAPVVRDRKGAYRRDLGGWRLKGFTRAWIDGVERRLEEGTALERHKRHSIDLVIDRLTVRKKGRARLSESIEQACQQGNGEVVVRAEGAEPVTLSTHRTCPSGHGGFPELEPRLFSFNSPHGACSACDGLGRRRQPAEELVIRDPRLSIRAGALKIMNNRGYLGYLRLGPEALESVSAQFGIDLDRPWEKLPKRARKIVMQGSGDEEVDFSFDWTSKNKKVRVRGRDRKPFEGVLPALERHLDRKGFRKVEKYCTSVSCPDCRGSRLNLWATHVTFRDLALSEVTDWSVEQAHSWFSDLALSGREKVIGGPVVSEIVRRLLFLCDVGVGYLTLNRSARSLSGGEAQRVRLAAQVGSGLQGVLFVLDEPSIGLHPRDNGRLLSTLRALTSSGNTVIVVEHDEETIRASDCLVDVGPGAGREGGEVLAFGPTHKVIAQAKTLTTDYLQGRREITAPETRRDPGGECLDIRGARQHNLKNIDVSIPLGCFVAVTGVSGSGKSTLVDHILRRALAGVLQGSEAIPGEHDGIDGVELLDKVIEIDQQPIGRTPRSNPATYTGLMTRIRDVFAGTNEARMRGFGKGRFSFNVRGGRCEACEGGGVNVVELQFLADVRVVCEICGGRRYNAETMEILYRGKSIADVLDLTVADALEFFEHHNQIRQMLETLSDVGLGYITLGQPATSLSGGEAQRVKLAKELGRPSTGKTLYILDEPTTGLHFEDVRHLVAVLQRLVDRGNTVLVVEHNLELVKCADWVIDLGPDGGDAGGEVVALGTPKNVAQAPASHTGAALAQHLSTRKRSAGKAKSKRKAKARPSDLCVRGASIHNLDGVDVTIPQGSLTVVTGPSGSGKTSLAFHTIFAEGQRRYVESLSTYARRFLARMDRPPIESIDGISPAVAIDQKYASRNPRSTVATSTEIYDYLRLLFSRVGDTHCWGCGKEIRKWSSSEAAQEVVKKAAGKRATITCTLFDRENPQRGLTPRLKGLSEMIVEFAKEGFVRLLVDGAELKIEEFSKARVGGVVELVIDRLQVNRRRKSRLAESLTLAQQRGLGVARIHLEGGDVMNFEARLGCAPCDLWIPGGELTPRMFSFNNAAGACSSCEGLGRLMTVREDLLIDRPERPLLEGAMTSRVGRYLSRPGGYQTHVLRALAEREGVSLDRAWSLLPQGFRQVALHGSGDAEAVPVTFARGKGNQSRFYDYQVDWRGLLGTVEHWWSGTQRPGWWRGSLESLMEEAPCPGCRGGRLQPWALAARVDGMGIFELCQMDISSARQWVHGLDLDGRKAEVAADIVRQVQHRLDFLDNVGVGYLSLVRSSATLSGGESQRIRLASQLGNQLVGVLYVLDEPTIGLHPKDTGRLLETLKNLQALGNTVLVVEHDRDTIEAADHLIDLGPGAGESGGRVVFQGKAGDVYRSRRSLTGQYLSGKRIVDWPKERRSAKAWLTLEKATRHNLKGVTLRIPLGTLCVVTGVSGSGKSTLVTDLLVPATQHATGGGVALPEDMGALKGARHLRKVVVVDQSPVARSTQSNPATYTGCFDDIRKAFAETEEAKLRGFGPGRFSPNVPGGRCESCEGRGFELVEMHFLSDVSIRCESCRGLRFEKETLEVKYRGHSISDVLSMTVSEAITCFGEYAGVLRKLTFLEDVGLGYLRLGQPTNTLSGGEAQRLKLAAELARPDQGKALVVLDEPTTGLHFEDVSRLVAVLHRMVDMGDSVVVIEHNVDVIKNADWIVDLGPSGGEGGGQIMAEGPPEKIASDKTSEMASFVKRGLEMAAS